jgi:hypothetical protein
MRDSGDDHQTLGHGCADVRLVPSPADLLIRSLRADQRRVVGSNVRLAEPTDGRDVVVLSIPHDWFGSRRHRTLLQRTTPDLAVTMRAFGEEKRT